MSTAAATLSHATIERTTGHTLAIYLKKRNTNSSKTFAYASIPVGNRLSGDVLRLIRVGVECQRDIGATSVPTYLIATYGTFGVMGASLFGTASGLAADRGLGWLQVKRASPMPPFAYFIAKVILSMIYQRDRSRTPAHPRLRFGGVRMSVP